MQRRAGKMLRHLAATGDAALASAELSVALVDDGWIKSLNRDYRNIDKPTDVLAFAMREGDGGDEHGAMLGDVVISVPTARRQAERQGRSLRDELTMLLAHGLLHLLGYDHRTKSEERVMTQLTRELEAVAALPTVALRVR